MKIEYEKIEGNTRFDYDVAFHGFITGSVIVAEGSQLMLHGTVLEDLILEDGSIAIVTGLVAGNVYNRGGELLLNGIVRGSVTGKRGRTIVGPEAVVIDEPF